MLVASRLGQAGQNKADVNGDGAVNIQDLVLVAGELGTHAAAPSAWHHTAMGIPTRATVEQWLTQAHGLSLTDARSQRGILLLERLLATLAPEETALLTNYPNPFNPETWIPYHLSEPADVTLIDLFCRWQGRAAFRLGASSMPAIIRARRVRRIGMAGMPSVSALRVVFISTR